MAKKPNLEKTVEWFSTKQMLIKFDGDEDSTFLSDKVIEASNFVKWPIVKGDKVEVGITEVDGEDKVTYLRNLKFTKKTKATTKKKNPTTNPDDDPVETVTEAPPVTSTGSPDGEVKTIKIISVRTDLTALKYDGEKEWPKIKKSIQSNPLFKSKNVVDVKIVDGVITAVKASDMAQPSTKEQASEGGKSPEKKVYKGTNSSIEGQVAVKEAGAIIRSLIAMGNEATNSVEKIKKLIKSLTKECFKAMQEI